MMDAIECFPPVLPLSSPCRAICNIECSPALKLCSVVDLIPYHEVVGIMIACSASCFVVETEDINYDVTPEVPTRVSLTWAPVLVGERLCCQGQVWAMN